MAKEDAAETAKEVLRQIIRHRFWIAIGFAALFAVIAYFMGSGPVTEKAKKEISDITAAEKNVQAYASQTKPTEQYKPIVLEKTEIAGKDVNKAWKALYDRQAPFLTWPDVVQERFRKWGRKWPEDVDPGKVQLAVVHYIEAYPAYVDMVYKVFDPFDYETGKGIVAAPPKEALLRPAKFSYEGGKVPGLGKVWSAQERLWIQRTVLEVVHQVNKQAKDWDSAIIKQIDALEVGNPIAQDQRSLAKGEQPKKAEDILAPGQEAAVAAEGADAGGAGTAMMGGSMGRTMPMMGGGMRRGEGMGMGMGMGGGAAAGAGAQYDDTIYYITPEGDKGQYKILPVMMTVLVDQEHVQDLLVALENSPMSIQVMDIDLERPANRVTKPEKGEQRAGMGMGMGMMGMGMGNMGMMRQMMGQQGYGGMAARMSQMQGQMMSQMGAQRGMGGMMGMGQMGAREERKKVDVSNVNRKVEREKKEKSLEEKQGPSLFDPYFNIVQVTVYGQARFFNPPLADAEAPASPGEVAASPGTPDAGQTTPSATTPAGAAPAPAEKSEASAPAEKAAPAPAGDAKTDKAQPDAGAAPSKPETAKPADATKPAPPPAESARPDTKGTAAKK